MNVPYKIQILLSTFNGEKFLVRQLDSLLDQDYPDFYICIRDDGSSDNTCAILSEYQSKHANISVVYADNIGVLSSYFELIKQAGADFYALCDQDDIWLPEKLSRGVSKISLCDNPSASLYCSALQFVDSNLELIGSTAPPRYQCLENAVMENIATGCTVIFGESLRTLFLQAEPDNMHMHDWWLYLLASAFGNIVYDPESHVLYRRHENTVTGIQLKSSRTIAARLKGLWGFIVNKRQLHGLNQSIKFGQTYAAQLNHQQRLLFKQLERLQGTRLLLDRLNFSLHNPVLFNDKLDNYAVRLLVLVGKY